MNYVAKTIIGLSVGAMSMLYVGCGNNKGNIEDYQTTGSQFQPHSRNIDYEQKLFDADKVVIKEKIFSWGKDYRVFVDDIKVASVTGKNFKFFEGDEFILRTEDGKVIASEKEHYKLFKLDRTASCFDADGNLTGYIGEETWNDFFSLKYQFHVYDANQNKIGSSKKTLLSLLSKQELQDNQGNTDYTIHEKLGLKDIYEITVLDQNSSITLDKAIFLTCIVDAVTDAAESDSDDSSSDD